MKHPDGHQMAGGRAKARREFFVHAVVYVAVIMLLILINLTTRPGTLWFIWPLLGWGLAVALHFARVFLLPDETQTAGPSASWTSQWADHNRSGTPR